jgi:hypothetical protein
VTRALAHSGRTYRRGSGRIVVLAALVTGFCMAALVAAAGSARADGTWTSTSGTFTMTSDPGGCTGSGTGTISLSDTGSGLTGTATATMGNIDSGCAWAFFSGTISTPITGTMYSDSTGFTATDSGGDSFTGSYSGSTLTMTMVPGDNGGSGGGSCVEYCDTVFTFTFTGNGDLFAAGAFDFSSPAPIAAIFAGLLGTVGIAQGVSSARRIPIPPRPPSWVPTYPTAAPGGMPPPGAVAPYPNPNAVYFGDHWTAAPGDARTTEVAPSPIVMDPATSISLEGGGAFVGPPDYWTIPGGQPPPNSEDDPRNGKLLCPIHGVPVHPMWISYGPARPFLRWQCPVGPHLPWG